MRRENFVPSPGTRICNKHFTADQYQIRPNCNYELLKPDAVPSVFDFSDHSSQSASKSRRPHHEAGVIIIFLAYLLFRPSQQPYCFVVYINLNVFSHFTFNYCYKDWAYLCKYYINVWTKIISFSKEKLNESPIICYISLIKRMLETKKSLLCFKTLFARGIRLYPYSRLCIKYEWREYDQLDKCMKVC